MGAGVEVCVGRSAESSESLQVVWRTVKMKVRNMGKVW